MKAYAIIYGPNQQGVTVETSGGHTALAIFYDYHEAVSVLADFENNKGYMIIDVVIKNNN